MANVEKDFVVVQEAEGDNVGAGTFWSLSGDISLDILTEKWIEQNLPADLLLETPSAEVAFRRALKAMEESNLFVESVRSTGELALVYKEEQSGLPVYTTIGKWKLSAIGRPEQTFTPEAGSVDIHNIVVSVFDEMLTRINSNDVSIWLRVLVEKHLGGIVLRESGGFYFVPPAVLPVWRRIKAAVEAASAHRIYNLPMLKSADAVETILAACISESEKAITKMQAAFEENADGKGKLGAVALESMANKAAALKDQMARYETFLGVTMPKVQDRLEELRAGLFVASVQAASQRKASK